MNKLSKKFEASNTELRSRRQPEAELWSELFNRQTLLFNAMMILRDEIQAMKKKQ